MQVEGDLATLIYVQSHGNDSLLNYTKNTNQGIELIDSTATNTQNNVNNNSSNTGAIEINWGDFDLGGGSSSTPAAEVKPAEISVESAPLEIKWDIDVSGSGSGANDSDISNFEITIENEGT